MFLSGSRLPLRSVSPLKPFVLRTKDGFLVGLAMDPKQGAPCVRCVQGWLEKRGLGSQQGKVEELTVRRDLIAELVAANDAHTYYEVHHDGTVNKLKSTVFPLPGCECAKSAFVAPREMDPNSNFTFSPLTHIKCVRYVTPNGHLWLTNAVGVSSLSGETLSVYGAGTDKAQSRQNAIDTWLKQSASADLKLREHNEAIAVEVLQTGNGDLLSSLKKTGNWEVTGAGKDYHDATLDALYALTRQKTLQGYASTNKSPMLIVGANNWIRQRVPYFLLQEYDIHLLFYPNSSPCWVVGLAAFSRIKSDARPLFAFSSGADMAQALEGTLAKMLEWARPEAGEHGEPRLREEGGFSDKNFKLNMWWTHWIYRCSKITLKDILHLEAYPKSVEYWRDYLRDGQPSLAVVPINHLDLPAGVRCLVKLVQSKEESQAPRKVIGIGTLSPFQDAVL